MQAKHLYYLAKTDPENTISLVNQVSLKNILKLRLYEQLHLPMCLVQ